MKLSETCSASISSSNPIVKLQDGQLFLIHRWMTFTSLNFVINKKTQPTGINPAGWVIINTLSIFL